MYHMAMDKVGVSISEMQRLLEIKDYKTTWLMAHKIRKAMADRDARYSLAGLTLLENSFFERKTRNLERERGRRSAVLCAVALYRDKDGKERPGFAHMQMVDNASQKTIEEFLERLGCGVTTDEGRELLESVLNNGWRSCREAVRENFKIILRDPKAEGRLMPWVLRVISNAKAVISGAHRGVSDKHLQAYLSEICYRFNRRFWEKELFERLMQACISTETITYNELTKRQQ